MSGLPQITMSRMSENTCELQQITVSSMSDNMFEMHKNTVESLQQTIDNMKSDLCHLEELLEKETKIFQRMCGHEEYLAQPDGDYHKPGYYYTCKKCAYWTNTRPNGHITYKY